LQQEIRQVPSAIISPRQSAVQSNSSNAVVSPRVSVVVVPEGNWKKKEVPANINQELSSPQSSEQLTRYDLMSDEELLKQPSVGAPNKKDAIAYKNFMLLHYEKQKRGLLEEETEELAPHQSTPWADLSTRLKQRRTVPSAASVVFAAPKKFEIGDEVLADMDLCDLWYEAEVVEIIEEKGKVFYEVEFVGYDKVQVCEPKSIRPVKKCPTCYFPITGNECLECDPSAKEICEYIDDADIIIVDDRKTRGKKDRYASTAEEELPLEETVSSPRLTRIFDDLEKDFAELEALEF
jgi:hypothetical protein